MRKIVALLFISSLCFSFSGKKTGRSKNWISLDYVKCLESKLPCDCEKRSEPFLARVDTFEKSKTYNTVLFYEGGTNYDYNLYRLKKESAGTFKVFSERIEQGNEKTISVIGVLQYVEDAIYFTDTAENKTVFINYGNEGDDMFSYGPEHVALLNKAFVKRNYPSLENVLKTDSLSCACNWELGGMNLISGGKNAWILEQRNDSLFIYDWVDKPNRKSTNMSIKKKLFQGYKW
jgi:hypothetical protein